MCAATARVSQREFVRVLSALGGAAMRHDPDTTSPFELLLHAEHDRVADTASGSTRWARNAVRVEDAVILRPPT
jgi:hypothetical protein